MTTTSGVGSGVEGRGAGRGEPAPDVEVARADRAADSASPEVKRPAWNRMAGSDAAAGDAGLVMGTAWPALSEAAAWPPLSEAAAVAVAPRGSARVSVDSAPVVNPVSDGSAQGPVITPAPSSQPISNSYAATTSTGYSNNHSVHQRSFRGEDRGNVNGGAAPVQLDGHGHVVDSAPRDALHRANNLDSGSRGVGMPQLHSASDVHRNPYRRGHGGRPRGDFHDGHRGRRDQDRNHYEWNGARNFGGRGDPHMQQSRPMPRGFVRAPPNPMPYLPPPMPPLVNPMGYPYDMRNPFFVIPPTPHPDAFRGFSVLPPSPAAVYYPNYLNYDLGLRSSLIMQIDYYFSDNNLCKDQYLRGNMDDEGWVPISLISGFKKIKALTEDIHVVVEAMHVSRMVEVQGDRVRRKEWTKFPRLHLPIAPLNHDQLVSRMENASLNEGASSQHSSRREGSHGRSLSGGNGHSQDEANQGATPAEASPDER